MSDMVGARVRKAYQPHYEQIVLRLNRKGEPSTDLVIVRGLRAYASNRDRPMPTQPSQFAMILRKHLNNSRLIGVEQFGFDRVIRLEFEHGRGRLSLVIELFRDGNVLLLDQDGVIIRPLTHAKYASRSLKNGEIYSPPPEAVDPRNLNRVSLDEILNGSDHALIRTLASRANLGRVYGSTACSISGIDEETQANSLSVEQRNSLEGALTEMLGSLDGGEGGNIWLSDAESKASWVDSDNESERDLAAAGIVEFSPISLPSMNEEMRVSVGSLSHAYDFIFGSHDAAAFIRREEEKLIETGERAEDESSKLSRRASQQEKAIERFNQRAVITQELGKSIQDNWEHVDSILSQLSAAVEKRGWQDIADIVHEVMWVDSVNPSKHTVVAFLPDEDGEPGASVTLEVSKTVHQNAQRYFEEARTQKNKAKGAQAALEKTEGSRKTSEKKAAKEAALGRLKGRKRARRFWFEKYRWAILSGGHLLIGGKDAKGNDVLVRKHLSTNDLYFHADLHGAPSCSLKLKDGLVPSNSQQGVIPEGVTSLQISQTLGEGLEDARELDESVISEAAQMSVCWSRAWGSGGAAATAFHARSSQVSKTTETGESLARGSFVVRGERSWHRDTPLEIAIGLAVVNGVPLPVSGVPKVISEMCQRWAKMVPGREKKDSVANRISKSTGLAQEDVLSCLPPGGCSIDDHGLIQP
jgi:predicted ribosome quality control (RQC) complex YloA/Tae2 family protein